MAEKVALFLFSGPDNMAALLHTFIFTQDIVARGGEAQIVFEAASPQWVPGWPKAEHRLHKMYQKAKEAKQVAVCRACASMAGALKVAQEEGLPY